MIDRDLTDPNFLQLRVPADGELAIVHDGSRYWAPAPQDGDPAGRDSASEHWLPMLYEPVLSSDGKLIDVVAWRQIDPNKWWLLTGRGIVLGAEELERVMWTDLPCILVSTPAGWRHLQRSPQETQSICVLHWSSETGQLFDTVFGTIICASKHLESRLLDHAKGQELNTAVDPDP